MVSNHQMAILLHTHTHTHTHTHRNHTLNLHAPIYFLSCYGFKSSNGDALEHTHTETIHSSFTHPTNVHLCINLNSQITYIHTKHTLKLHAPIYFLSSNGSKSSNGNALETIFTF